jgi:uncharacterized protein YeaO (DUF488 family)
MAIRTYRIGSPRRRGEGVRVGVVRFLPRGVRKKDYARLDYFDVWLPVLAPSRPLLRWAKGKEWDPATRRKFFARYAREMEGNTDCRQAIQLVAKAGHSTHISVGCYCADESRCHRSVLIKLIRRAQKGGR